MGAGVERRPGPDRVAGGDRSQPRPDPDYFSRQVMRALFTS